MAKTKYCRKCCTHKPLTLKHWHKHKSTKSGWQHACRECHNAHCTDYMRKRSQTDEAFRLRVRAHSQKYQQQNKHALKVRRQHARRKKYGLTVAELAELKRKANGRCTICRSKRRLYIDHCHKTGRVRGLLCFHCNTGLGQFVDDPKLLTAAIKYLAG